MRSDDYWYQVKKGALDDKFLKDEISAELYKKESDLLDLVYGQNQYLIRSIETCILHL